MKKKPIIDNKSLESITTLALLVGRFDKLQIFDIAGSDGSIFNFEIEHWREDSEFRKNIEAFRKYYNGVQRYFDSMNQIIEKQNKYRIKNNLDLPQEYLKNKENN